MKRFAFILIFVSVASFGRTAKIRWSPVKEATDYRVEISRHGNLISVDQTQKAFLRKALPPGQYTFRVKATDKNGSTADWTKTESFDIPIPPPTLQLTQEKEKRVFYWEAVPDATGYRFVLSRGNKILENTVVRENKVERIMAIPGTYTAIVIAQLEREAEPVLVSAQSNSAAFLIEPPRDLSSVAPSLEEKNKLRTPNSPFSATFNLLLVPYRYWTQASENSPVSAQGMGTELAAVYRLDPANSLIVEGGLFFQQINQNTHTTKALEIAIEREYPIKASSIKVGIGLRTEDWFHLTTTVKDSIATLSPSLRFQFSTQVAGFQVAVKTNLYSPIAILSQSELAHHWTLGERTWGFEPRAEIGRELSTALKINGGVLWAPRHLNLTGDYIQNRGLAFYLGSRLQF